MFLKKNIIYLKSLKKLSKNKNLINSKTFSVKMYKKVGKISTKEWNIRISKNNSVWDGNSSETYLLERDPNAQLEILEVQEVAQPQLIPEMYHKSFWVTFKIKADFGKNNNIDGALKVRYLIYKYMD